MRLYHSIVPALLLAAITVSLQAQTTAIEPAKPVRPTTQTGKLIAITDVPGIEVGHFEQRHTGTTVVLIPKGAVGGVDVRGSAPGTRETDLLDPTNLVDKVDAVVLTGGSAYGLATAHGVMRSHHRRQDHGEQRQAAERHRQGAKGLWRRQGGHQGRAVSVSLSAHRQRPELRAE